MWSPEPEKDPGTPWAVLYDNWDIIKLDMLEQYGRDLDDPEVVARTSWHWFEDHLGGLMSMPIKAVAPSGRPLAPNRLQLALMKD